MREYRNLPSAFKKPIGWRGSSLWDLRACPDEVRREVGHQLHLLQQGKEPTDWKPMSAVGPGTIELRIHTGSESRVFVVCKFEEAIYVFHIFTKTSQKTPKHDIDLARQRYQDLVTEHRQR